MRKSLKSNRKSEYRAGLGARYCSVAAGLIGAAVVGGVASNSAASKAAKSQKGASDAAATSAAIAQDQWDTYKETYQPAEKAYLADALAYDSPENRENAAGLAASTVASQFGKAREVMGRTPGLDPSSAAYAAGLAGLETGEAAANATSQNKARQTVDDQGWARRTDALSLGKGLPAQASAGLSSSANISSSIAGQQAGQAGAIGSSVGNLAFKAFNAYGNSSAGLGDGYTPQFSGGSGAGASSLTPVTSDGYVLPDLSTSMNYGL